MSEVRFAIMGCGRLAGHYLSFLEAMPRARCIAVCDLEAERARTYAERYGLTWYSKHHRMLEQEDIDVVAVLTPSGMHAAHTLDLIQRYRKHVIVEKPLVLRMEDLAAVEQAAAEAGVRVFPVFQYRYNRAVIRVRRAIEDGDLGKLALGSVRVWWSRDQSYYDRDAWRGTWSMDGGALTNQGIHYLDLLVYLMGDVETVSCATATRLVDVPVEDAGVAWLRFRNGALGSLEVTTAARPRDFEASVSILAEGGAAVIGGVAANELALWTLEPDRLREHSEEFPIVYGFGHGRFLKDVVDELLDGKQHPISFEDASRALRVLWALYRSAEEGRAVDLNEGLGSLRLGERTNA